MPVFTSSIEVTADYPTIKPSLNLNFARSRALDPRITFTRASVGTYVGRDGLIKTAANNEARFDHDPVTLESLGLLIEESRTNYLGNSEMLANWSYGQALDTFTASSGTQLSANPDGSSPAYHYVPSTTSGLHRYNRAVTLPTLDTDYVVSLFVKRVTAGSVSNLNRYVELETTGSWAGNSQGTGHSGSNGGTAVTFDLQDLAIQSKTDNTDGYTGDAKIEDYGNGWYRLSYVFNPGIGSQYTGQVWWGHPTTLGGDSSVSGNGNPSFYFWGASVEQGAFITSHIPTPANSSVTRAVDVAFVPQAPFAEIYNPEESTVLMDVRANMPVSVGNQRNMFHLGNDNSDGFGFFKEGGGLNKFFHIRSGGGTLHNFDSGIDFPYQTTVKFAAAFTSGDQAVYFDDVLRTSTTDTSGLNQSAITIWNIGASNSQGANPLTGTISKMVYYPKRVSNAQLLTLRDS